MTKVKLALQKKPDGTFELSTTAVKNAMTTNALVFPASGATVTLLGTKLTTFSADLQAYVDAKAALDALLAAKDNSRAEVEVVLRDLAGQVDAVAKGDVEIIHLAGMQASNEPAPVFLTQVLNLRVAPSTNDGELDSFWDRVLGARYYQVQVCLDATTVPTNWTDKVRTTKTRASLNDTLVSGSKVWVRVRAEGAGDPGSWSDPAWKTVP